MKGWSFGTSIKIYYGPLKNSLAPEKMILDTESRLQEHNLITSLLFQILQLFSLAVD